MATLAPEYYTSLRPFRGLFATGVPVLTYHKVGPRPRGARLKGLYVSKSLLACQLQELRRAGFFSVLPGSINLEMPNSHRQVVLTFDDGFANVLEFGHKPLAANGFQAIQFLVPDYLGRTNEWDGVLGEVQEPLMDVHQVREWLAAGHAIGSHTLTHPYLTRQPPAKAKEEITASRKKLEDTFNLPIRDFCYPYGDWNPLVRDLVAEAGYETACTTDFGVNTAGADHLALKRIMARYPSRGLKPLWRWFRKRFAC
jgi:peptidoglycan/xylan/chitin deacetylase (PgdA/CDA1 family)